MPHGVELLRPDAALEPVTPGALIVAGPGCGTPTTLLRALGDRAVPELGWELWSGLVLGPLDFAEAVQEGRLRYRTWQVVKGMRELMLGSGADFMPLRASAVPGLLAMRGVDVALVRVSPPDSAGNCSLGASVSYPQPLVGIARRVIAEVDEQMPRTAGQSLVHVSAFAAMVDSQDPTPEHHGSAPDERAQAVAQHIMALLPERPVLQVGLGAIPEAVAAQLVDAGTGPVRFVGMGTDAMVNLFDAGVLLATDVVPDPAIAAVELMGTRRLLDRAHNNSAVGMYPLSVAGDPLALAQLDRFVSINSAVQVDLSGQCNAEWVGGRQVAGPGGGFDFMEAARGSAGGIRIVALPSTTGSGSRVVARLPSGAPVTIPRHSVDYVVTEHGVAAVGALGLRDRAEALLAIAAPEHREALRVELEA